MKQGRLQVEATPYGDTERKPAHLTFVDNTVDNTTGTIKLKAHIRECGSPAVARAVFDRICCAWRRTKTRPWCRRKRCRTGSEGDFIYVVKSDTTAEQRAVKVGRTVARTP